MGRSRKYAIGQTCQKTGCMEQARVKGYCIYHNHINNYNTDPDYRAKINFRGNMNTKRYMNDLKQQLMNILSQNKCVKCGFDIFIALAFDHINGGGAEDRKRFHSRYSFLRYYIDHPEEARQKLQVLCMNHNTIKLIRNKEGLGRPPKN